MSEQRLIIRGILVNYLHLATAFLSMFILTPIIIGRLGPTAYGLWAVFSSVVGYFVLCDFGMSTAVAKYTAEYRAKDQLADLTKLVSTTFAAALVISGLIIIICAVMMPYIPGLFKVSGSLISEGRATFLIMGINVALMLLGGVFGNIIYGYQRVDVWKTFSIIQLLVNGMFTVLFLQFGFGLIGVAVASILGTVALISLQLAFLRRSGYGISVNPKYADVKIFMRIAPYSARTFLLGITNRVINYSDFIVVGIFLGASSVAHYEITYKLCFLSTYLFSIISSTLFPRFSRLFALGDLEGVASLFLLTAKLSVAIMTPVAIFLYFWGGEFIGLWVGPGNFAGNSVLSVFVAMSFVHVLGTPAAALLQAIGKNEEFVYSEIANAVLNLGLSILLVRPLGLLGVALGTLVASLCTSAWVVPLLACRSAGLPKISYLKRAVLPPLLVGAVVAGIAAMVQSYSPATTSMFSITVKALGVAAVYSIIYLACASTQEEREMCSQQLQRLRCGN